MQKTILKYDELLKEKKQIELKLNEYIRNYNINLELLEKSSDGKKFIEAILDEYISRLNEFNGIELNSLIDSSEYSKNNEKFKSLLLFATQATVLSEKVELIKKLDKKNDSLVQTTNNYINMLSFASHELRSPLVSILGFAELLSDNILGEINEEQQEAVGIIIKISKNLMNMVKNYLDLAEIESGKLKLTNGIIEIKSEIIDIVVFEMKEQFSKKNMKALPDNFENISLVLDKDLISVVFTNLFTNAIKYGKEGTDIIYSVIKQEDDYLFTVKNEGIGVKSDKLISIFKKFTRIPELYHRDTLKGAGLGLFIAEDIIERHGGKIWVESQYGEWFKVFFTIPVNLK